MHIGKYKAFQANLLRKSHGLIHRLMVFGSLAIRKNQRGWSRCGITTQQYVLYNKCGWGGGRACT